MSRFLRILALVFCCAAVAWASFTQFIEPEILYHKSHDLLQNCGTCHLDWSHASISLLGNEIILEQVNISQGDPDFTAVSARIERVTIRIALSDLFFRQVHIQNVTVDSPQVVVTEGDGKYSSEAISAKSASHWTYKIDSTTITAGRFTYVRTLGTGSATIHIKHIFGTISALGTALMTQETKAEVKAQLEDSGHFTLIIHSPLYAELEKINLDLKIEQQNISDMNSYFENSDGILLHGKLLYCHAFVGLLEHSARAWVRAKFEDLNLHFQKTRKRSALTAFISNLVASVKLQSSDLDQTASRQTSGVTIFRKNRESLVSFLLRGMMASAIKVAEEKH